jgi:hypothetical protein
MSSPSTACGEAPVGRKDPIQRLVVFLKEYAECLRRWRAGNREVVFPYGTYAMRVFHGARCAQAPPTPRRTRPRRGPTRSPPLPEPRAARAGFLRSRAGNDPGDSGLNAPRTSRTVTRRPARSAKDSARSLQPGSGISPPARSLARQRTARVHSNPGLGFSHRQVAPHRSHPAPRRVSEGVRRVPAPLESRQPRGRLSLRHLRHARVPRSPLRPGSTGPCLTRRWRGPTRSPPLTEPRAARAGFLRSRTRNDPGIPD